MSENQQDLKPGTKAFALRVIRMLLSGCFGFALLTGCESLQDTAFAPITVVMEPATGGAQHFVVVNSSGQTLHNFWFRAYLWDDQNLFYTGGLQANTPRRLPAMTYSSVSSGTKWEAGKTFRFTDWNMQQHETSILTPVSRVQIVGHCDEGRFREDWQINSAGQWEMIKS